ncbi:MAG: cyclic nucleotide-binding domain-containing protein [Gammaproteobacteria bacterium]|nr:MAG: cyclic nucleotide-binding domain-containing protein [Gammaproteobacteria bacterium]
MPRKPVEPSQLKAFSPLDGLKMENLKALARKTSIEEIAGGRFIFKQGDAERRSIFIVSGEVELRDEEEVVAIIHGGSREARSPIAPVIPRTVSARARSPVEFISVDSDLVDVMLTWDQTGSYEVSELRSEIMADAGDWMTTLLQTKAFHRIPAANIQAIFMRMEQVNYKAGDVIIKQGEQGDFFYVVTDGKCVVTRETPLNKEGIKLAELEVGDTFGEEALISEATRNATVTMLTDGSLVRLGKDDFHTLMNEPMLHWVEFDEASDIIAKGGKWLDVRLPSEFENFHQSDAINIPLYFIRLKLKALDTDTAYVVCCDTGRRSSAAAYILSERGFNAHVLKGGLNQLAGNRPKNEAEGVSAD